jgi:hypothetical protein
VGFLLVLEEQIYESLEGRLKAAICESLEGRLKAAIVTFNHHWRAEEVGSKAHSCFFFFFSMCCKLVYYAMLNT